MQNYIFNYERYSHNLNRKRGIPFSFLIILLISLLGICFYFYPKPNNFYELFFVEINHFETYKQANILSTEIQQKGAAGYIHFDNTYRVLASYYTTKSNAENVAKSLKDIYPSVSVHTIKIKKQTKHTQLTNQQKNIVEKTILHQQNLINNLYNLSIDFDTNKINETILKTKLKILEKETADLHNSFFNDFKTDSKYNTAKENLLNIQSSLEYLSSSINVNFSQALKYQIIDIVINYSSFVSCF